MHGQKNIKLDIEEKMVGLLKRIFKKCDLRVGRGTEFFMAHDDRRW